MQSLNKYDIKEVLMLYEQPGPVSTWKSLAQANGYFILLFVLNKSWRVSLRKLKRSGGRVELDGLTFKILANSYPSPIVYSLQFLFGKSAKKMNECEFSAGKRWWS